MNHNHPHDVLLSNMKNRRANPIIVVMVTVVLGFFFSVPLTFIAYGALGGLAGGLAILALFILCQFAMFWLGQKLIGPVRWSKPEDEEN
jgi:hypothetical protein